LMAGPAIHPATAVAASPRIADFIGTLLVLRSRLHSIVRSRRFESVPPAACPGYTEAGTGCPTHSTSTGAMKKRNDAMQKTHASSVGLALCLGVTAALAQPPQPAGSGEFRAGEPLGTVNEAGERTPITDNVKVFGSFRFAESCTFDPERNLILAMNAGVAQEMEPNDGYVSLINPDGTVHTSKWIGETRDGLTLNQPLGSAIQGNLLYVADIDTVRTFDLATGEPRDAFQVPEANVLNGIGVSSDGTIYVSNTRPPERIYKITADGEVSVFVDGAPLAVPNGVAIDP